MTSAEDQCPAAAAPSAPPRPLQHLLRADAEITTNITPEGPGLGPIAEKRRALGNHAYPDCHASATDVVGARIGLVGRRGPDSAGQLAVAHTARRVDPGQPHVSRPARYFGLGRLRVRGSGDGLAVEGPDLARLRGDDQVPGPIHRIRIGLVP